MARCCQPGLNDPAILGYYEFNECYCRHSILSCCCTKQWIAPGEGCINNKDFDVHDWERGTRLRTEFERLLTSTQMQEALDKAPKVCPGCLGGCRSRMAQGPAINASFCPEANQSLLLKAGYKCDAFAWVTHGSKGERQEHLAIRIMNQNSVPAVEPNAGFSEEELSKMGPNLQLLARCTQRRGGQTSPECCLLPHLWAPVALLATMLFMLIYGVNIDLMSANLPPSKMFSEVGGGCRILGIEHEMQKGGKGKVFDAYTYDFTEIAHGGEFRSIAEKLQRDSDHKDTQEPGSFVAGQNVTCWQPTAAGNASDVLRLYYTCGNSGCIRVFSPYVTHAQMAAKGMGFTIGGVVEGIFGIAALATLLYFYWACKQEQMYLQPSAYKLVE